MQVPPDAAEVLQVAENELRRLIEEALRQARYQEISSLAALADAIAQLKDGGEVADNSGGFGETKSAGAEPPLPSAPVRRTSRAFPRFERDGDKIVKIAWSKRNRSEYEHRAPREVADLLIDKIKKKKGEGAKFEAGEVLPLKDKESREIPSYQAYLALAWLRFEGLVVKHGREQYSLKPGLATREKIDQLITALPQK